MQKFSSNSFIIPGRNILTSDSVVSILFCFLKTMLVVGYLGSDFQSSLYAFGCQKDVPTNYTNIVTDKCQNKLSELMGWSLHLTDQMGKFLSQWPNFAGTLFCTCTGLRKVPLLHINTCRLGLSVTDCQSRRNIL